MCKSTSKEELGDFKRLHLYHADEERITKARFRSICALYFVNFIWKLILPWFTNKWALRSMNIRSYIFSFQNVEVQVLYSVRSHPLVIIREFPFIIRLKFNFLSLLSAMKTYIECIPQILLRPFWLFKIHFFGQSKLLLN